MKLGTLHANCGCGWVSDAAVEEAKMKRRPWQSDDDQWMAVQQSLSTTLYMMVKHVRETGHSVEISGKLSPLVMTVSVARRLDETA